MLRIPGRTAAKRLRMARSEGTPYAGSQGLFQPDARVRFGPRRVWLTTIVALVLAHPAPAEAYLDPGTGSMLLQAVAAAFIGGLFTLKLYWRRVKAYLARPGRGEPSQPVENPQDGAS